tara:strand:- start:636 stop:806 length:171 start_codon:yes stop_codon:yes gene_type:complete
MSVFLTLGTDPLDSKFINFGNVQITTRFLGGFLGGVVTEGCVPGVVAAAAVGLRIK